MSSDEQQEDELLERAARAYREEASGSSPGAARTRARILATRERARQQRMIAMAAAALLAVGLGVPSAWAWATGRLETWIDGAEETAAEETAAEETAAEETAAEETAAPESSPAIERTRGAEVPSDVVAEGDVESGPEIAPPLAAVVATEETTADPRSAPASRATGAEPVIDPRPGSGIRAPVVDPAERSAYREAHALHFDVRDASGALGAWDRYLATYPDGRFAIEARYNRALCLVRLDRRDEARLALAPFASGRHGEYRQREATALIEALAE
jgi:hypothetical protein